MREECSSQVGALASGGVRRRGLGHGEGTGSVLGFPRLASQPAVAAAEAEAGIWDRSSFVSFFGGRGRVGRDAGGRFPSSQEAGRKTIGLNVAPKWYPSFSLFSCRRYRVNYWLPFLFVTVTMPLPKTT